MQCLSRKKDEEFLQFFVLFLSVGVVPFDTALSHAPAKVCFFVLTVDFYSITIVSPEGIE